MNGGKEIKSVAEIKQNVLKEIDRVRAGITGADTYPAIAYALTRIAELQKLVKIENVW